jgi:hypothetical protein
MSRSRRLVAGTAAAAWTLAQHRRVRRGLPSDGVRVAVAPPRRPLPAGAVRVVLALLRLRRATCLERSLILQAWLAARGEQRDVVIGVRGDGPVRAHAWLDGLEDGAGYVELHRLPG